MATGTYRVYIDWINDGDFADLNDEVTARVVDSRAPLTVQYGRDARRALSPIAVGEAHFPLNNQSRDYSPENSASPLAGQVVPARAVQITGTVSGGGTYTMYRGQLDDFTVLPSRDDRYITVNCIDALGAFRGVSLSTSLYQGLRPGEAIGVILDALGWPASARDLDTGGTVMPYWWLDKADAFTAIMDLVAAEGPPALVTVDGQGRVVFRGRHHRLQNSASTTVQSTWRASGTEPLISPPADYNAGFKEIINTVAFDLPMRATAGALSPVWAAQGQISIADGDTVMVTAAANDPFDRAVVPEQGTDYTLLSGVVSMSLSRTSGQSTTIAITASGGTAVIVGLQLRAASVTTVSTYQVSAADQSSTATYGPRSLPSGQEPSWASLGDALAITQIILAQRADRLPTITVTMKAANTLRLTQQLTRDLSDRVHVTEPHTGLDVDCFIEQISHTIEQGGASHVTQFGLEKAPAQITGAFILGSATAGVLGTNKLGRRGFTDPTLMFVLGSGVLGTNVLTP